MKRYTGHLLIAMPSMQAIVPATFTGNGLAVHRELSFDDRWVVAHVSSGMKLRGMLRKREADRLLAALASEDWSFHKDRVTAEHARRVREILEAPQISRGMVAA